MGKITGGLKIEIIYPRVLYEAYTFVNYLCACVLSNSKKNLKEKTETIECHSVKKCFLFLSFINPNYDI